MNVQFTPVEDFFSEEFRSEYLKGLSYTARPEDRKLLGLLPGWVEEGKVRLGAPKASGPAAKVTGSGEVMTIGAADVGALDLKGGKFE